MAYGTLQTDVLNTSTGVFSTNNAYSGIANCWAYFTYISSTLVTVASYNVSSITRSSTGQYVITFANALPDANYAVVASCGPIPAQNTTCNAHPNYTASSGAYIAPSSSSFNLGIVNEAGTAVVDPYNCAVVVHR